MNKLAADIEAIARAVEEFPRGEFARMLDEEDTRKCALAVFEPGGVKLVGIIARGMSPAGAEAMARVLNAARALGQDAAPSVGR